VNIRVIRSLTEKIPKVPTVLYAFIRAYVQAGLNRKL